MKQRSRHRAQVNDSETNLRMLALAVGAVVVAILLFWISNQDSWYEETSAWQATWNQIAALIVATALITIGWELFGKRTFASEVLQKAQLSAEIVDAGIVRVTDSYLEEVEWAELFDPASRLDIVVAYARTWRNAQAQRLQELASRRGTRIRVFLPDPEDPMTMSVLADRFNTKPDLLAQTVHEAIEGFAAFGNNSQGAVEVWVRPGDAVFTCYRFDSRAVLTLYSHGKDRRTSVPTFVVRSGKLMRFIDDEIASLATQSRRVFPSEASEGVHE